jgi:flagellar motor switch protein FliM
MKVGDIIPIDLLPAAPLHVEHMPLFSGEFGVHNGRNAIKVTQVHSARPALSFDSRAIP